MAITSYNLKKWYKMLAGKSVLHVNQDIGKCFSVIEIKGYYNNLTEKVTKEPELLEFDELPKLVIENGDEINFPVAIFQYGLGAYDLFLTSSDEKYLRKFRQCVDWAIKHQEDSGAWSNFFYIYKEHPYGAMCQGEGASLLIRAYKQFKDESYIVAARKAIEFMLKPVEQGGTSVYTAGLVLLEYTHLPVVLNGWIFSAFGLYDMSLITKEKQYKEAFEKTINTMLNKLAQFDNGYWSLYDLDGKITSPFYHNLHIAQMQALYQITGNKIFNEYVERWQKFQNSFWKEKRALIKKAIQKVME
jgi:D-glucuronyl C5-epimerase C-terminus.